MAFEVKLSNHSAKYIGGLDYETGQRIKDGLKSLQKNPFLSRPGADIKMLRGVKGGNNLYRLRVGDYRALYEIFNNTVLITKIFHRGKGYEWL